MNGRRSYVYILASKRNGTLYIGVTNDISRRVWEHKQKQASVFTRKYGVSRLVYYEVFEEIATAIQREKQMKEWQRSWKLGLIEGMNPEWKDLYEEMH